MHDGNKANANVNKYTQQVNAVEISLRFLESYKPKNIDDKRQQELAIQRLRQDLQIANIMLTVAQNDVRRLNREALLDLVGKMYLRIHFTHQTWESQIS